MEIAITEKEIDAWQADADEAAPVDENRASRSDIVMRRSLDLLRDFPVDSRGIAREETERVIQGSKSCSSRSDNSLIETPQMRNRKDLIAFDFPDLCNRQV